MGKDLIAELKARAEKATPGTWEKSALAAGYIVHCDGHHEIIASVVEYAPDGSIANTFDNAEANADFITAANPQAVLALIAEVERLEAIVNGYKVSTEEAQEIMGELQAENARLDREADWLAQQVSLLEHDQLDGTGCHIREVPELREQARNAVAEQA